MLFNSIFDESKRYANIYSEMVDKVHGFNTREK